MNTTENGKVRDRSRIDCEKFQLGNGLTVLVHSDHRQSRVHLSVGYRVGSKDERSGRTGFAHLFEHLMFTGSANLPGSYTDRLLDAGAVDVNGATSQDMTLYHEIVPTGMLEYALFAEADRMGHFAEHLSQEELDRQRDIVLMEKREREGGSGGKVAEYVSKALYAVGHPYRHTVIGEESDLVAATLDDAREWCNTYYTPTNAVLVLVGDVEVETARQLVMRHFAHIPPGPPLLRPGRRAQPLPTERRDRVEEREAGHGALMAVWPMPDIADPQSELLGLACAMLNDGEPTWLESALVEGGGPAEMVSARVTPAMICGEFVIDAHLSQGHSAAEAEKRLKEVISAFITDPVDNERFERVRRQELQAARRIGQNLESKAHVLMTGCMQRDDAQAFNKVVDRLRSATPQMLQEAVARWLSAPPYLLEVLPFGDYSASTAAVSRETPPPIVETAWPERAAHAGGDRLLGSGARLRHTPEAGDDSLAVRLIVERGACDLSSEDRPLGELVTMLAQIGAGGLRPSEISDLCLANGLNLRSRMDPGRFTLDVEGATEHLSTQLRLFADQLSWSGARDAGLAEHFERQKKALSDQLRREIRRPAAWASTLPRELLLGRGHPLSYSARDMLLALPGCTLEGLREFHGRLLQPGAATLLVAGLDDPAELGAAVEAAWPAASAGATRSSRRPVPPPAPRDAPVQLVEAGDSGQTMLHGACLLPQNLGPTHDWAVLALNGIIGGSPTSRLNQRLREQLQWTYGVQSQIIDAGRSDIPRMLMVHAAVDPSHAAECLREINSLLNELCTGQGPTEAEVKAFVRNTRQRLPGTPQTAREALGMLDFMHRWSLGPDFTQTLTRSLGQLNVKDVKVLARELLAPSGFRWALAGDSAALARACQAVRLDAEVVLPPAVSSAEADGGLAHA